LPTPSTVTAAIVRVLRPGVHGIERLRFNRPCRFDVGDEACVVPIAGLRCCFRADLQAGNVETVQRKPLAQRADAAANVQNGALPIVACRVRRMCLCELAGPGEAYALTLVVAIFGVPRAFVDRLFILFAHRVSGWFGVALLSASCRGPKSCRTVFAKGVREKINFRNRKRKLRFSFSTV
jgi:hypothetical protein